MMGIGRTAALLARACGRSWTSEMPFAPELRGAFLFGEVVHGYRYKNEKK